MATTSSKPYLSYEARQAVAYREARDAEIRTQVARNAALQREWDAKLRASLELEVKRFRDFEKKYGAVKLHKMVDSSGKWWQHRDISVLRKFVNERNRTINSPAYRSIQETFKSASRPSSSDRQRAMRLAMDDAYWSDDA